MHFGAKGRLTHLRISWPRLENTQCINMVLPMADCRDQHPQCRRHGWHQDEDWHQDDDKADEEWLKLSRISISSMTPLAAFKQLICSSNASLTFVMNTTPFCSCLPQMTKLSRRSMIASRLTGISPSVRPAAFANLLLPLGAGGRQEEQGTSLELRAACSFQPYYPPSPAPSRAGHACQSPS